MSIYTDVNRVLIGDGANASTITALPQITKGDLFLINEAGVPVTTNAAAAALPRHEKVRVAMGIGSGLAILSSPIQGNTTSKYEGQAYVSPSERVVTLGYNGNSGTGIAVTAGSEYRLRIRLKDSNFSNGNKPSLTDFNYPVPVGGTVSVALSKIAALYDQTEYGKSALQGLIKLERVANGTRTVFPNTAAVVKGSKSVTITAHVLAVGTPIRLDVAAHSASSPVYLASKVVDANTIELDVAYKGETGTITLANSGSLASVTEWGLKLSGLPVTELLPDYDDYTWIDFEPVFSSVDNSDFASVATTTVSTPLVIGQGFWKQVRGAENKAKAYLGQSSNRRFDDKKIASNVVEGTTYSSVTITHTEVTGGNFQDTMTNPLKTNIYIPAGSNQGLSTGDNFVHVLNGFFSTKVGFTALGSL
jgi:hypothetical protein